MEKPNDNLEPKRTNENNPKFSYLDLKFDSAFTSEGQKIISFLVNVENPYFIDMYRWEFEEYQRNYFDQFDKKLAEEACTCDITIPEFEFIMNDQIIIDYIDEETGKQEKLEIETPVYFVSNLVENFSISMHLEHPKKDDLKFNNFNLN